MASQAATPAREMARRPRQRPSDGGGVAALAVTRQLHRRWRRRGGAGEGQSCAPAEVAGRSEAEGILVAAGELGGSLLAAAGRGKGLAAVALASSVQAICAMTATRAPVISLAAGVAAYEQIVLLPFDEF